MIKDIIKSFFFKVESYPDLGFPTPNMFLERNLRDTYYNYYHRGTGMVLLSFLLFLFVFHIVFGDRTTKSISKLSIIWIALVWVTPHTLQLRYSAFHLSPLYIPTLNIPLWITYFVLGISTIVILQATRNLLKQYCAPKVCKFLDLNILIMALMLFLPWISGETWIDW